MHPFDKPDDDAVSEFSLAEELGDDDESLYGELPDDWDDPEVQDVPEDEEAEVTAELSDVGGGSSVVVLSGPRAGTVVEGSRREVSSAARPLARPVASAAEALAPGEVLMLVHRPGRYANRVPHALARAHSDFSHTGLHLGVSANLPRKGAPDTAAYLGRCGAAAVRIADPEGYALPGDLVADPPLTPTQTTKVGYAAAAPPVGEAASVAWNQQVIRSQRAAGANVLLTPGRTLDHSNPGPELEEAGRALEVLLDEVDGDEVPAWNLSLRAAWLIDTSLRDQLLAELVDRDTVLVWHVRVRWPVNSKPYGQALQSQLLEGYRELAETARQEERALILPNTGLTGWLTLGWGTTGFGTGPSQTTQAWKDKQIMRSRKDAPRPAPVLRHHSRSLLHTISVVSHLNLSQALDGAEYPACGCPYCAQQADAPSWLAEVDAGHVVYDMAALAAEVAAQPRQDRAGATAEIVQRAIALEGRLPVASLDAKETPDHLPTWMAALT